MHTIAISVANVAVLSTGPVCRFLVSTLLTTDILLFQAELRPILTS